MTITPWQNLLVLSTAYQTQTVNNKRSVLIITLITSTGPILIASVLSEYCIYRRCDRIISPINEVIFGQLTLLPKHVESCLPSRRYILLLLSYKANLGAKLRHYHTQAL